MSGSVKDWLAANRRSVQMAAGVVGIVLVAGVIGWWFFAGRGDESLTEEPIGAVVEEVPEEVAAEVPPVPMQLYFPGEGGRLYAETRDLPLQGDAVSQVTLLMETLLQGPESTSLRPPLGAGASLRRVYLMETGAALGDESTPQAEDDAVPASIAGRTVVLDFATEAGLPPRTTGSQRERLMAYSLVNTVLMNFEGGRGVLVLWNGQQQVTFAGQLDTGRPLLADRSLVANHEPPPYGPDVDADVPSMFPAPPAEEAAGDSGDGPTADSDVAAESEPAAQGDT